MKVFVNSSGDGPKATTAPDGEPLLMVIMSVAMLLVNLRTWPATAPLIVEYSPANTQVSIETRAPKGSMVAVPYGVVFAGQEPGGGVGVGVGVSVGVGVGLGHPVPVVISSDHPPAIFPESPLASSTT